MTFRRSVSKASYSVNQNRPRRIVGSERYFSLARSRGPRPSPDCPIHGGGRHSEEVGHLPLLNPAWVTATWQKSVRALLTDCRRPRSAIPLR